MNLYFKIRVSKESVNRLPSNPDWRLVLSSVELSFIFCSNKRCNSRKNDFFVGKKERYYYS